MSALKLLSAAVFSVAALAAPSSAQQATPWPATCICKPTDPRGANLRYARFQVDDRNLTLLKARFAEIGNAPMQKAISVPNSCTDPRICVDRKQVVADEATMTVTVMGRLFSEISTITFLILESGFTNGFLLVSNIS